MVPTPAGMTILLPLGTVECELRWALPDDIGGKHRFRPGDVALVGSAARYEMPDHAGCLAVHVPPDDMVELGAANLTGVVVHDLAELAGDDLVLWEVALRLRRLAKGAVPASAPCPAALTAVFVTHLLQAHVRALAAPAPPRGLTPRQLRAALDFIATNLKEPLTTAAIARQAHLSVFHFTRLFKASTGLAPRRYLLRARVLRARELLLSGDRRVSETAHALGFCDQSHLDRHFRRLFGYPPKTLLKLRRAQD